MVGAAALRVISGGQSSASFLIDLFIAIAILGLIVLYGDMRLWNATVYVKGNRVGVTNAFGMHSDVPVDKVDELRVTRDMPNKGRATALTVLKIVPKDHQRVLEFRGANRLEPGGIERIAKAINVPVRHDQMA